MTLPPCLKALGLLPDQNVPDSAPSCGGVADGGASSQLASSYLRRAFLFSHNPAAFSFFVLAVDGVSVLNAFRTLEWGYIRQSMGFVGAGQQCSMGNSVNKYRAAALACDKRAEKSHDLVARQHLIEVARLWRQLAEYAEPPRVLQCSLGSNRVSCHTGDSGYR